MTLFLLIGLLSMFWETLVPYSMEGLYGFTYMTSFLFALSIPVLLFCFGAFLILLNYHLSNPIRKFMPYIVGVIFFVAAFKAYHTFTPMSKDFPMWQYKIVASVTGIALLFIGFLLTAAMGRFENALKSYIRRLNDFILLRIPNAYISDIKLKNYEVEAYEVITNF